jgi:hypothetical protein
MKGYRLIVPLIFSALLALGIFILFSTGSDLAITIILLFIPVMIGISFLVRYLITIRKRSIKEKVMERDIMHVANCYAEQMRMLHDFENKYTISTEEFRKELKKVKEGLFELGCTVNGRIKIDKGKLRGVVFADVEWVNKLFEGIKERHEVVIYSRMMDTCADYLKHMKELEAAGYESIQDHILQIEAKIRKGERLEVAALELSMFMNEVAALVEETLRSCLRDARSLEIEGSELANADTARIRTDIKIGEQSIEHGNYENAANVLKRVIERLIKLLEAVFDQYKEGTLELATAVSEILDKDGDKNEVEEIRKGVAACMLPSQIAKLHEHADALVKKSLSSLEEVYNRIFEIEEKIAKENPSTEVYPVEYWSRDKMSELEQLKSIPASDIKGFTQRYGLVASDAHSRLVYDSDRLEKIRVNVLSNV